MKWWICLTALVLALTTSAAAADLPAELERAAPEAAEDLTGGDLSGGTGFAQGVGNILDRLADQVGDVVRERTRGAAAVLLVAVLFLLGFLIGRGHTGGGDDEEYDDEPPRTPAKPLIPEERHTARVPRLVPREESSDSDPAAIPDKTPADPVTPAAPAEKSATAERSAQDEPTQADEDEVRTMSLDDLLDDIHNM